MSDNTVVDDKPTTEKTEETKPEKVEFSPEQNDWISKRIAYEVKTDREKREAADAEAKKKSEAEAERKKQEEAGQFDEVKRSIETERDGFKTRAEQAEAEREKLADYVKSDIAAVTKTVRDAKDSPAAKVLMRIYPGDDADPLTLLDWAQNAKASLSDIEKEIAKPGNGPDPRPAGRGTDTELEKRAKAALRPRF